ncbi:hypothetical protein GQ53DRAFT_461280 [Thozetella sp. PMI_491]|nr:hypothetical protein GQ53DRAFT_461280 [Thozetella sp. PMI_491]
MACTRGAAGRAACQPTPRTASHLVHLQLLQPCRGTTGVATTEPETGRLGEHSALARIKDRCASAMGYYYYHLPSSSPAADAFPLRTFVSKIVLGEQMEGRRKGREGRGQRSICYGLLLAILGATGYSHTSYAVNRLPC